MFTYLFITALLSLLLVQGLAAKRLTAKRLYRAKGTDARIPD